MTTSLKSEFRLSKFGLGHHDPALFIKSQWLCSRCLYVMWRIFWFLWHLGWSFASPIIMSVYDVRTSAEGAKWFIYLTNITLLLTTLTCTLDAVTVCYLTFTRRGREIIDNWLQDKLLFSSTPLKEDILFQGKFTLISGFQPCSTPWYMKLTWLLYNVIGSSNIMVTIMYWAVVYDGSTDVVHIVTNTINTVFIISNLYVTAMPCQLLHFIYPVIYGTLYFIFTYIYFLAGGTNIQGRDVIYTVLDWHKVHPTVVGVVIGVIVCVPIAHLLLFSLYTFRLFIYYKLNSASFRFNMKTKTNNSVTLYKETNSNIEIMPVSTKYDKTNSNIEIMPVSNVYEETNTNIEIMPVSNVYEETNTNIEIMPVSNVYEETNTNIEIMPVSNVYEETNTNIEIMLASNVYEETNTNIEVMPVSNVYEETNTNIEIMPVSPEGLEKISDVG